jgi:hypothetical protein
MSLLDHAEAQALLADAEASAGDVRGCTSSAVGLGRREDTGGEFHLPFRSQLAKIQGGPSPSRLPIGRT